nr:ribonuclease H-like domain-containing protein [Tanacetum cinerariifolium]
MGFVDGTCIKPATSPILAKQWEMCNVIILGWILSSLPPELYLGELYVPEYCHKLNSLWKEFEILTLLPACTCAAHEMVLKHNQLIRLMQFLMGLNDVYQNKRSNILARDLLPDVKEAFNVVSREESHRGLHPELGLVSGTKSNMLLLLLSLIITREMTLKRNPNLVKHGGNSTGRSFNGLTVGHPNETLAKITADGNMRLSANIILFDVLIVLSYDESKSRRVSDRAFMTLFGQDNETFTSTMFLYLGQLHNQLDKDEFQEDKSMAAFWVLNNQFQKFIDWQYFLDYDSEMTKVLFAEYTRIIVKQFKETLLLHMRNVKKSVAERTRHKRHYDRRMNERQMQSRENEHITSSSSGTYITHVVDADIRPVNDQVPSAEVDSNTTPDSTNMCHKGGEIDQDAEQDQVKSHLLKAEFLKTNDMVGKRKKVFEATNHVRIRSLLSFVNFKINDLKAQLQAKTTLICNLKNQIKSVKEASNEAKLKKEINVLETINIELESSMAKLLAENEKLHKENEHLKQTYKELYDSIIKTRIQTNDHNDSLIAQVNSKTVENADLKARIQEKVFANAALKNKLRKLNGTCVDTKFAKPSTLGKPVLQPHRHQSVVRQPNAFKSERPNFSKPWVASKVDVINVLSKPVTPHYLPKVQEYVLAKPHHVIAPSSSRNSQQKYYGSNDMAHNHYLEEARKKTQEINRNSKPSVMPSVRLLNTANGSTPNPKRTNQASRSLSTSKSSCITITVGPKADHSRNSSSFSDSRHFFCSTCHKCVLKANHDACVTELLNEVNSRKTKNSNKPIEQKSYTQGPGRQISSGHRFSPKKTFTMYEKISSRSCLRWKPTGKIFINVGLKWIPTEKLFDSCTSKVNSEPPNGSNDDITNPYECDQTLNVSA